MYTILTILAPFRLLMKAKDIVCLSLCGSALLLPMPLGAQAVEYDDITDAITGTEPERAFTAALDVVLEAILSAIFKDGLVTLDGAGHSLIGDGNAVQFTVGQPSSLPGTLTVKNWGSWNGVDAPTGGWQDITSTNGRLFSVANGATLSIENSVFSDNKTSPTSSTSSNYAFITNSGSATLNITESAFVGNRSTNGKSKNGFLINNASRADISGSLFQANTITSTQRDAYGAAIYNSATPTDTAPNNKLTLVDTVFRENVSAGGGAIYNVGHMEASGCEWIDNSALGTANTSDSSAASSKKGGAIWNSGTLIITAGAAESGMSNLFSGNQAVTGGALYNNGGELSIAATRFEGNMSTNGMGGAIHSSGGIVQVYGSVFDGNRATTSKSLSTLGGAVNINSSTSAIFVDTDFTNNVTTRSKGGAIASLASAVLIVAGERDVTISGNRSGVSLDDGGSPLAGTGTADAIYLQNSSSSSSVLELNAGAGRTITFAGNGIEHATSGTVHINRAEVDTDLLTTGTQAAGTEGTVAFIRDAEGNSPLLKNLDLRVHGGMLTIEDAMMSNCTVSIEGESAVQISNSTLALADTSSPAMTLGSSASLTLGGCLVIELSNVYSSVDELVVGQDYTLNLVDITSSDPIAASELALLSSPEAGLKLADDLDVVLTLDGQQFGYTINRDTLQDDGVVSFTYRQASPLPVPEPATATLSLFALAAMMQRRRRR